VRADHRRHRGRVPADLEPADADTYIADSMKRCTKVVACWGTVQGGLEARVRRIAVEREVAIQGAAARAGRPLLCFGTTKTGSPRHPLYLLSSTPLVEWRP
jgi:hypothetical protein